MAKKSKSKSNKRNIERLKLAQQLLERKELPDINAPDLLDVVTTRNRSLRNADLQRGPKYPMPEGVPSIKQITGASQKAFASEGMFVDIKTKYGKYKTRIT